MAFTGTPVVEQLNDHKVRITGITLDILASGTVGLTGATGTPPDITLPANFKPAAYTYNGASVSLQACVDARAQPVSSGPVTNLPLSIAKTGTAVTDFRITFTNTNSGLATQTLEIYVVSSTPLAGQPAQIA